MIVIHQVNDFKRVKDQKTCVAIGMFDGVHLGHQQVLKQTVDDAKQHDCQSVAVTFDQHPAEVIRPDQAPPLIYPLSKKLKLIESLGLDACLLIHFDKAFSQIPPGDFIKGLLDGFGEMHSICVGNRFTFGHQRQGNISLLKKLGTHHGFKVHGLAALSLGDHPISSTRIRQEILSSNLDVASQMLGRGYGIVGEVVQGAQRGRQLGFPTANIQVDGLVLPETGVYAARVFHSSTNHRALVNIGWRPTFTDEKPALTVEAHLLDFKGNLYGETLETELIDKIREEFKFQSLEDLRHQIQQDIASAKMFF